MSDSRYPLFYVCLASSDGSECGGGGGGSIAAYGPIAISPLDVSLASVRLDFLLVFLACVLVLPPFLARDGPCSSRNIDFPTCSRSNSLCAEQHSMRRNTIMHMAQPYYNAQVKRALGAQCFPVGGYAIQTYLPDEEVGISAFLCRGQEKSWFVRVNETLCKVILRSVRLARCLFHSERVGRLMSRIIVSKAVCCVSRLLTLLKGYFGQAEQQEGSGIRIALRCRARALRNQFFSTKKLTTGDSSFGSGVGAQTSLKVVTSWLT